jgi:hypothetical protein
VEATIQQIVDDLAGWLGRPAVLEDRTHRLIAYSSHDHPVDAVRESSILRRRATSEVARWLAEVGVRRARHPVRVPANDELGMLARLCVPILWKERVLGHLWFIDPDQSIRPDEVELCVRHAAHLAVLVHRDSVASSLSSARLSDAVQALLSASPNADEATRILEEDGDFIATEGVVAVVVQGVATDADWTVDIEEPLSEALAEHAGALRREPALHLLRKDQCVLLLAAPSDEPCRLGRRLGALTDSVRADLRGRDVPASVVVGVGGHRNQLADAAESYRESRMAADAAMALPGMADVVYWSELGVNQIVVKLASLGDPPVLHAGLHALLDSPEAQPMIETLETYLDVAGNAQLTAERLNLHRTSLYYRLQRVEQLAKTDLKDGLERLALHLAIKVARLTGEYDNANTRQQPSVRAG